MNDEQYLAEIRRRIDRFNRIPGVHLPTYEEHAGIDFGKYLCLVRDAAEWSPRAVEERPADGSETRGLIAEHLVRSVQDLEELLRYIASLESENLRLRSWLGQ
jgi:hypothetical protein